MAKYEFGPHVDHKKLDQFAEELGEVTYSSYPYPKQEKLWLGQDGNDLNTVISILAEKSTNCGLSLTVLGGAAFLEVQSEHMSVL